MLKIKDNIDLKELEKYGFEYISNMIMRRYRKGNIRIFENDIDIDIDKENSIARMITIQTIQNGDEINYVEIDNVIFDLIKADLVEKVEV